METMPDINQNPYMKLAQGVFLLLKAGEWEMFDRGFLAIDGYLDRNNISKDWVVDAIFIQKNNEDFTPVLSTLERLSLVFSEQDTPTKVATAKVFPYFKDIKEAVAPIKRMRGQHALVKTYFINEALSAGILSFSFTEVLRLSMISGHNSFKTRLDPNKDVSKHQASHFMDLIYEPEEAFNTLTETILKTLFMKVDTDSLQRYCINCEYKEMSEIEVLTLWSNLMRKSLGF